jgi:DNA invertase Pin-like site-specific DNA recombinase
MKSLIAYYRVSTQRQGQSGLGLDAQRAVVAAFAEARKMKIVGEYIEIESGRKRNRPQLSAALMTCKKQRATLVVAKLDRLARNVGFLHTLLDSHVDIAFCDMPEVSGAMGRFLLISMANVAELEAGLISERTKAALAAAQARGVVLGNNGLARRNRDAALARAEGLRSIFSELAGQSAHAIAAHLNARKVATPRGLTWSAQTVIRVQRRLAA